MIEPVLVYLEKTKKYEVIRDSIHNYLFKILKYKPDVIIIASVSGAQLNYKINKLCGLLGIKIISFTCEGDFREDDDFESMFWGWNRDKIMYEDLIFVWSDRIKKMIRKIESLSILDSENKVKVTGYSGIDRYIISPPIKKNFSKKNFKKVILITAFNFDTFGETWDENKKKIAFLLPTDINDRAIFYQKSLLRLRKIYKKLISNNQDILFLLKPHPALINFDETEFKNIKSENTILFEKDHDLSELLTSSDLIISFESTTCLEAWLLNKPTILVNPIDYFFPRSIISGGSPIIKSYERLNRIIKEFILNDSIKDFDKLKKRREDIIFNVIKHSDGFNHRRSAIDVINFLENNNRKKKIIKLGSLYLLFRETLKLILINTKLDVLFPSFRAYQYNLKKAYSFEQRTDLMKFYQKIIKLN